VKILIISDGKKGHLNQSIAFCKLIEAEYDILEVEFKNRIFKLFSYLFDWLGLNFKWLYKDFSFNCNYDFIVSAGSTTYYANKFISKRCKIKNIALMYPKGYRLDFYKVFAQKHDISQTNEKNVIILPINFSFTKILNLIKCTKCVGIIIGGSNNVFKMKLDDIKPIIDFTFKNFKTHKKFITTSPRTPKEIEEYIEKQNFDFCVIYSKNRINPISDVLKCCEYVFVTIDSTSMISEAVSFGKSSVEVIMLEGDKNSKYYKMVENLQDLGCLHIFDGNVEKRDKKIDLKEYIKDFN